MKRSVFILILFILISCPTFADFEDVKTHWGEEWVNLLVEHEITSGYPDGTFKPNATISVEEFLTFTIKSLQAKDAIKYRLTTSGDYWSVPYIHKAIELKLITENEISDYRRAINREEMASIIMNAYRLENPIVQPSITPSIAVDLFDYYLISERYIDNVLTAVKDGFITGKDKRGTLLVIDPKGTATRAEASVVIIKLLDQSKRTAFISDRPHTEVMVDMWNGSETVEVPVTFYAPKNTEGKYVTEVFGIYEWLEENETDRIPTYYAWNTDDILTEFRCDPKHEADYEGEFWVAERTDIDFSFDTDMYDINASPYMIRIVKRSRMLIDYETYSDYVKANYAEYIKYIFDYFFEENSSSVLTVFYDVLENGSEYVEYDFNGRNLGISGYNGVTIWFDELVE